MKTIQACIKERMGFIPYDEIDNVINEDERAEVIVRCGGARFITNVIDSKHLANIIENEGRDYVRDISLSPAYMKGFK